ncbi:MAG: uroporphyrinogen-III C-methyltransferase [Bacteroidota bacterium]
MTKTIKNIARVTLVGAGPGDPDLITRKGLKALHTANVLLYDALVAPELLDEVPDHCLKIYVGKRAGSHYKTQKEINALLVRSAKQYGHAVRLKGGDPFVFGRGHEEKVYAETHGIPVQVVPGISSCVALPELQGIPPTRRGVSQSFWVMTASTRDGSLAPDLKQAAQSNATAVILMGLSKLSAICDLWTCGSPNKNTPIMVIQNGSRPDERVWTGRVNDLEFADRVHREKGSGPAIIVIGEVVDLANYQSSAIGNLFVRNDHIDQFGGGAQVSSTATESLPIAPVAVQTL